MARVDAFCIELTPKSFFKKNLYLILFLLFANLCGIVSKYYFDHDYVYGLVPLFDLDTEKNIPTLYSSIALLFAGFLLLLIAVKSKNTSLPYLLWFCLSLIFLFLSIDEISSLHEHLIAPMREKLGASGFLYYAWVIPYGIALVIFIIVYLKFLLELPRKSRILFLISGAIFVTGAIGFELLGGKYAEAHGTNNFFYSFLYTCEESFEMFGIALFIYTLLIYIVEQFDSLIITVTDGS